jgi:hypothetical protein
MPFSVMLGGICFYSGVWVYVVKCGIKLGSDKSFCVILCHEAEQRKHRVRKRENKKGSS